MLPASAGMIPGQPPSSSSMQSAPRIRGDDPTGRILDPVSPSCSPHPRGRSGVDIAIDYKAAVLPASAGMILS